MQNTRLAEADVKSDAHPSMPAELPLVGNHERVELKGEGTITAKAELVGDVDYRTQN